MAKKKKSAATGGTQSKKVTRTKKKTPSRKKHHPASSEQSAAPALVKPGFAVVGIGASAGGLDAFKQFFTAMPGDTDMVFVLIQHLDPTHESLTAELLGKHTAMKVVQVTDEMRVEPNCVYVIPPNKYLTISGHTLHLTQPVERRGVRVPIDFFFRSLADDQQERAIGIILSGTGADGTLGVREIKAAGGMVMVQAPETAQYDGMPRSAIAAGVVDYILPVKKMPDALIRYVRHWYVNGAIAPQPATEKAPDDLTTILGLLRARVKYDFSCYKKGTLTRRVQRRMGLKHIENMGDYVEMLRQDKDEVSLLYKDLLIGVTNFFREPEAWLELEKRVIEPLVAQHRIDSPIRVWVPGCATGEEPFSIAMLLTEKLQDAEKYCDLHVFASDIDQDALAFARAGVYPENIAADVTPERLRRFFIKGEHTYRINKDIREAVVFAEQNVISDPPFSKLDLVSCRNLLIYLEPDIQKKILGLFHFALHEDGFLFLGNAETINQQEGLFNAVSRKWRIYRRTGPARQEKLELSVKPADTTQMASEVPAVAIDSQARRLAKLAQQVVLQRFAPACVLVNRNAEVLYLTGPVDQYLQLPGGELTADLVAMARPGLRTKLRSGVQQAIHLGKPLVLDEVRVKRGRRYFPVRVNVELLRQPHEADDLVLITFDEAGRSEHVRVVYVEPPEPAATDKPETAQEYEAVIRHLEGELANTREDLQTTIEELETSNEEFKAANEEVSSINEELQSTNEELETSKEELQSLNEELQTVNSQLETKVSELELTTNDLSNLLSSIDYATVFLDRQFCIRRFTPATRRLLRLIETDVGRPFSDFVKNIADEDLLPDSESVLKRLTPIEKEIQDSEGHWYARRIVPYRTEDDRIDGVVITFVDITSQKRQEASLRKLTDELEHSVEERTNLLQMMHDITAAANRAFTADEALKYAVDRICHFNGWHAGHVFLVSDDGDEVLPTGIWYTAEGSDLARLVHVTGQSRMKTSSKAMVATVVRTGEPLWIEDVSSAQNYPRNHAGDLGVRAAVAFPVFVGDAVSAVLEFYTEEAIARDERFLEAMQIIGTQLGRVMERKRLDIRLAEATIAEQQRLGQILHDSLGQQIAGTAMIAAALKLQLTDTIPASANELLVKLESNLDEARRQVRWLAAGLFPVDVEGGGLAAALERLAAETRETHGLACRFEHDDHVHVADSHAATQLYLIAREAIHNAAKHSGTDEIVIRLFDQGGVVLTVTDNGCGLPADAEMTTAGMGLSIMRHRASLIAADIRVESPAGGGTMVSCVCRGGGVMRG